MRTLLSSLAIACVFSAAFGQQTQPGATNPPAGYSQPNITQNQSPTPSQNTLAIVAKNNNLSYEDAAAAMAIAKSQNMDVNVVIANRGSIDAPFFQLAPAYIIANQSGKSVSDVWALHSGGQSWLQISQQLNVPTSSFNSSATNPNYLTDQDVSAGVWQGILQNSYGMTNGDFTYFNGNVSTTPLNEVVVGTVVANQDNAPIRDVMTNYGSMNDWSAVNQKYGAPVVVTGTAVVTTPVTVTPPVTVTNPDMSNQTGVGNQTTATTTTTTTQTSDMNNPATTSTVGSTVGSGVGSQTTTTTTPNEGTETTTTTSTLHARINYVVGSETPSPVEEWQVNGRDINPYNYWSEQSTMTSRYGLSRHHARRHHHVRHHSY